MVQFAPIKCQWHALCAATSVTQQSMMGQECNEHTEPEI